MEDKSKLGLMPKASKNKVKINNDMSGQVQVIESFNEMIQSGQVSEFIITGLDNDGQIILASYCGDLITGLGMMEMGKLALMNQQTE